MHGDLGPPTTCASRWPSVIFERLPTTMLLGALALGFALVLAIPLGVLAAIRPNSMFDRLALTLAVIGQAMPTFWFALTLILWLGIKLAPAADHGHGQLARTSSCRPSRSATT